MGAFALYTVATATEDANQFAPHRCANLAQRQQYFFQRIRRMCVIHNHCWLLCTAEALHAPATAFTLSNNSRISQINAAHQQHRQHAHKFSALNRPTARCLFARAPARMASKRNPCPLISARLHTPCAGRDARQMAMRYRSCRNDYLGD